MANEQETEEFKIFVTVEKAKITRILESKQDPFVMVKLGDQVFQTSPQMDVATNPFFNETFMFDIVDVTELEVELYDYDDPTKSDLIGTGLCSLKGLKRKVPKAFEVQVSHRHKSAGTVFLKVKIDLPPPEKKDPPKEEPKEEPKENPKPIEKPKPRPPVKPLKKLKKIDRSSVESFQFANYFHKDPKLSKILVQGLLELHRSKPKNPVIALGEYLLNYSEQ